MPDGASWAAGNAVDVSLLENVGGSMFINNVRSNVDSRVIGGSGATSEIGDRVDSSA